MCVVIAYVIYHCVHVYVCMCAFMVCDIIIPTHAYMCIYVISVLPFGIVCICLLVHILACLFCLFSSRYDMIATMTCVCLCVYIYGGRYGVCTVGNTMVIGMLRVCAGVV